MADFAQILIRAIDQSKGAFDSARNNILGLQSSASKLNSVLANLGVGLSVAGLAAYAKGVIDTADRLNDLSRATGVSIETLASFKLAAEQNGTTLDAVAAGLGKLAKAIGEGTNGNVQYAAALKAMGISAKDPQQAFFQLADSIAKMRDPLNAAAPLAKLLDKNFRGLLPLLTQGGEALRQAAIDSASFGQAMKLLAPDADKFNDQLVQLKVNSAGTAAVFLSQVVPAFNSIIEKMREAGKEGSVLKTILAGLGEGFNLALHGSEFNQALDDVKRLQDQVVATQKKIADGGAHIPFTNLSLRFNPEALATLKKNLAEQEALLGTATQRLQKLQNAGASSTAPKQGGDEIAKRLCLATPGGVWNGTSCDVSGKSIVTRLPNMKLEFDAEAALTKAALEAQGKIVEAAFGGQLISLDEYWSARRGIVEQQFAQETSALQKQISDQQNIVNNLSKIKPKDANQAQELKQRITDASSKLTELKSSLTELNGKKVSADFELKINADKAKRDLADTIASLQDQLAQASGTETDAQRRQQVETRFRELLAQLGNDAAAQDVVGKVINLQTADANLAELQRQWSLAMQEMQNAEAAIGVRQATGQLDTLGAQNAINAAHAETSAKLSEILPKAQAVANAIGPDAVAKVEAWKNEFKSTAIVVDKIAESINVGFADAMTTVFMDISSGAKSAKDILLDFEKTIVNMISRIAAQNLSEALFGSSASHGQGGSLSGIGPTISGLFSGSGGGGVGGFGLEGFISSFFKGIFGGGKADGGPLMPGKWYIAGEKGPEPIWGGGPGAMAMGYGSRTISVVNNFAITGPADTRTQTQIANAAGRSVRQAMARNS